MGKAARIRRQRQHLAQNLAPSVPATTWPGSQLHDPRRSRLVKGAAKREFLEQIDQDAEMPCRATYLGDPVFGGLAQVTGVTADGGLIADHSGSLEQIPVLLFEPSRAAVIQDKETGLAYEWRNEVMITLGFHRVPSRFVIGGLPAEGWGAHRAPGAVLLRDADGAVRAKGTLTLDPEWISAAASFGSVLVFFGPLLGVRVPDRLTEATYNTEARADEFKRGRREGTLLAATVKWRGVLEEAVNWVLFAEGSFGLPRPFAYVPSWHFKAFGGPEAFGFTAMSPNQQRPVALPIAMGLAADLTLTDFDLIRPDTDKDLGLVTGYYAGRGDRQFTAWQAAVLRHQNVMVLTGRREITCGPGAQPEEALAVLLESQVAMVPLTPSSWRRTGIPRPDPPPLEEVPDDPVAAAEEEYGQLLTGKLRTQGSYSAYAADALSELIDSRQVLSWATHLWPVVCQTCTEPLGSKAHISADGPLGGGQVVISLHHSACRASGVAPDGVALRQPTSSFAISYLEIRRKPSRQDIPVMVINPSCEQLLLAPHGDGTWRNATLDNFALLGMTPATGQLLPLISGIRAEMTGTKLTVDIPEGPSGQHQWRVEPPEHVRKQISRHGGLLICVTTRALPTLMGPQDLAGALTAPEALIGRVELARPAAARRCRPIRRDSSEAAK